MEIIINGNKHKLNKDYVTVLDALRGEDIWLKAPCGGLGVCGKCQIKVIDPDTLTPQDMKTLSQDAIDKGIRLACTYPLVEGLSIELTSENMTIESDVTLDFQIDPLLGSSNSPYGCAVDIGTTTVVMKFFNLKTGEELATKSFENPQKSFGADVISRITYGSTDEGMSKLHLAIKNTIHSGVIEFMENFDAIQHLVVSGNTTMVQLLLNLNVNSLGQYPFEHQLGDVINLELSSIFEDFQGRLTIIPPISTFVGGDISSGVLSLDMIENDSWQLLIDLGTNGELALVKSNRIVGTATAAGPVFEGVSLDCGMSAIAGAIYDVKDSFLTIGDLPIAGICGTGAISIMHWMLEEEYMDSTGRLVEDFHDDNKVPLKNGIYVSQKDIRAIQTAKSAIRTGVDILLDENNLSTNDIQAVYIAGGFGNKLNIDAFCSIGILPMELKEKTKLVGNTSLKGAVKCLLNKKSLDSIKTIQDSSIGIHLNDHPDFQDLYIKHMYF